MKKEEILNIVKTAVRAADSKKAENIEVIGIADLSVLADYFVICSGTSSTQIKAIADEVEYQLDLQKIEPHHIEGKSSGWICMDYGSVIVHVFTDKDRAFFNLERLWRDGELLDIEKLLAEDEANGL